MIWGREIFYCFNELSAHLSNLSASFASISHPFYFHKLVCFKNSSPRSSSDQYSRRLLFSTDSFWSNTYFIAHLYRTKTSSLSLLWISNDYIKYLWYFFSVIPLRCVFLCLSARHLQVLTYINDHVDTAWYHSSITYYVAVGIRSQKTGIGISTEVQRSFSPGPEESTAYITSIC